MPKDKIVLGILVGLLSDAVKLTFNFLSFKLNFTPVVFWQLVAATALEKKDIFTAGGILIGAVVDIIATSLVGVIFVYIIYITGKENLWIKGIGFGMFIWIIFFVIVKGQLIQNKITSEPSGIFVTIIAHFLFGLSLAVFTRFFGGGMSTFIEDLKQFQQHKSFKLLTPISLKKSNVGFKKPKKI